MEKKIKWFLIGFFTCVFISAVLLWWNWPPDESFGEVEQKYNRPSGANLNEFTEYDIL